MNNVHTLGGYIFLAMMLLSLPAGFGGLVYIWRPSSPFALAGKFMFSVGVIFGMWLIWTILSAPIPCQTGPCG